MILGDLIHHEFRLHGENRDFAELLVDHEFGVCSGELGILSDEVVRCASRSSLQFTTVVCNTVDVEIYR